MKIIQTTQISGFGGMNFVLDRFNTLKIGEFCNKSLPALSSQSKYTWKDIFYSLCSIYLCHGDCMEDLNHHLKQHFRNNPLINMPSADTMLRRMAGLATASTTRKTPRGIVEHKCCTNKPLEDFMMQMLNKTDVFEQDELVLDYDNTIIFNEKKDSNMSYKQAPGYQPGVATLNREIVFYLENRNGNSDAKSLQADTFKRLFEAWERNHTRAIDIFRADAASYQYEVISYIETKVNHFFIGCRNSYVDKYYSQVTRWEEMKDDDGTSMEVGCTRFKPFKKRSKKNEDIKEYRLVVKRKKNKSGQVNMVTQDAYDYRSIITNDFKRSAKEIANIYNQRGGMERTFDILKNDFGWNKMPFSSLEKNHAFLILTAVVSNLYRTLIKHFSLTVKWLAPTFRLKKFIFRFIILPAKWIKRGRQKHLKIYSLKTYPT